MATMKDVKFVSSGICLHTTGKYIQMAQTVNVMDTDHTQHGNVWFPRGNKLFMEMKKINTDNIPDSARNHSACISAGRQ